MKKIVISLALSAVLLPCFAQGLDRPDSVYFKNTWCPTYNQYKDILDQSFSVEGYKGETCCLHSARPVTNKQAAAIKEKYAEFVTTEPSPPQCIVPRLTREEEIDIDSGKRTYAEVARPVFEAIEQASRVKETERQKRIAEGPARIRGMQELELCELYGDTVRGIEGHWVSEIPNGAQHVAAEVKRRNLRVRRDANLRIGDNDCSVYAAYGEPEYVNTTVTGAGKMEQYVYSSGRYVYMRNGRVSGFQY